MHSNLLTTSFSADMPITPTQAFERSNLAFAWRGGYTNAFKLMKKGIVVPVVAVVKAVPSKPANEAVGAKNEQNGAAQ